MRSRVRPKRRDVESTRIAQDRIAQHGVERHGGIRRHSQDVRLTIADRIVFQRQRLSRHPTRVFRLFDREHGGVRNVEALEERLSAGPARF